MHNKRCKIIINMLTVFRTPKIWIVPIDSWGPVQACYNFSWMVLSLKGETLNYPLGNRFRKHTILQHYALGPQKNSEFISPLIHKISFRDMGYTKVWSEFCQCLLDLLGFEQTCSYSIRLKCLLFQKCSQYVLRCFSKDSLSSSNRIFWVVWTWPN